MTVFLELSNGSSFSIGGGDWEECDKIMKEYIPEAPPYWRVWQTDEGHTMIDFGSHTRFFKLVEDK